MCKVKNIDIPLSLKQSLQSCAGQLAIRREDVKGMSKEKTQELLFAIAVLIQNNARSISKLQIRNVPISGSLMNTFSVALQVLRL